jgi:hypothetical protein
MNAPTLSFRIVDPSSIVPIGGVDTELQYRGTLELRHLDEGLRLRRC